jgi:hypothetical protein
MKIPKDVIVMKPKITAHICIIPMPSKGSVATKKNPSPHSKPIIKKAFEIT